MGASMKPQKGRFKISKSINYLVKRIKKGISQMVEEILCKIAAIAANFFLSKTTVMVEPNICLNTSLPGYIYGIATTLPSTSHLPVNPQGFRSSLIAKTS